MLFLSLWGYSITLFGNDPTTSDSRLAMIVFVAGAVGSAGSFLVMQIKSHLKERSERADKKEESIVEHQRIYITRLTTEKQNCEEEGDRARQQRDENIKRAMAFEAAYRMALSHVRYIERILQAKQLSHERFEEPEFLPAKTGTDEHRTIAPNTHAGEGT